MRRQSLVEELQGKPDHIVQARIHDVLSGLDDQDRNQLLQDYNQKASASIAKVPKEKTSLLVRLLDAFFDRKSSSHASAAVGGPMTPPTLPVRPSAPILPKRPNISSPTSIPDVLGTDKQIADYVFLKTLGKGTFGKVKLAQNVLTHEQVAIKVIEKANIKTPKQKISVEREVRLMKLLHHPHIVGVKDVFESKDCIWIVMEHASGGELFDYIVKNGMIKEVEARKLFRQVLSAVEYCHQNSVIHRDLKPENLLLDANLNIKIIDFGFGNTYHRERLLDTYCGSPFYAAPEMIQGIRYIGPEVDVWSMGVILYALLSGRLPFDASNMNELYEKIAKGRYVCPSHFSPEATHLIARMLTVDPKKRAPLLEVRNHSWVNYGFSEPIKNFVADRPLRVLEPHPESLQELVSYGFKEDEVTRVLQVETNLHPIVSLYHLIDETRRRKQDEVMRKSIADYFDARSLRTNSLASLSTPRGSVDSVDSSKRQCRTETSSPVKMQAPRYFPRFGSAQQTANGRGAKAEAVVSEIEISKIADRLVAVQSEQDTAAAGPVTRSRGLKNLLKNMQI